MGSLSTRVALPWLGLLLSAFASSCSAVDETRGLLGPPAEPEGAARTSDAGPPSRPDTGVPDASSPAPGRFADGAACSASSQCLGPSCLRSDVWRDGYCTRTPCTRQDQCMRSDSVCVEFEPEARRLCAARCGRDSDCRDGYTCQGRDAWTVCLPDVDPTPRDRADGSACARDEECRGGTCLLSPEWPDGYCTTLGCDDDAACNERDEESVCAPGDIAGRDDANLCMVTCRTFSDCREGYACLPVAEDLGICFPDRVDTITPSRGALDALDAQCGLRSRDGQLTFPFEVPANAKSYMVTAFSRDGRALIPRAIHGAARPLDFRGRNAFQAFSVRKGWFANPLVPHTLSTRDNFATGLHTFTLDTRSEDVCWYLSSSSVPGRTLDINVYLVGVPNVDASDASRYAPLQAALTTLVERLSPAGVSLGQLRYLDAPAEISRRLSVVRSRADLERLVAMTERPGPAPSDAMSLNIVFVASIQIPDANVLGVSSALPGPGGLHGTSASGVVSTSEYLDVRIQFEGQEVDGSEYTGTILAHEVGHYLGLFHTTERGAASHDPVLDTPECSEAQFPDDCPDRSNLMFPFALFGNRELTRGQVHTIRANPLVKE